MALCEGQRRIWVVRHGDDLYIWSYRGPAGSWYQAAQQTHEGRIIAGGVGKDVRFVDAGDDIDAAVDDAYRTKVPAVREQLLGADAPPASAHDDATQVPRGDGSAQ
jgi:hypothetical protein